MLMGCFKSIFEKAIAALSFERHRGHSLMAALVAAESTVVDCGAHRCEFVRSVMARRQHVDRALCVEANPRLIASVTELPSGTELLHAAVVGDSSVHEIAFTLSENPEASSLIRDVADSYGAVEEVRVPCITLEQALARVGTGVVDLVKLDIEGAELDVLMLTPPGVLKRITQLTVEFHDCFCPEMKPRVHAVRRRLRSLGFLEINANWPHTDDVLFLNARSIRGRFSRLYLCLQLARVAFMLRGSAHLLISNLRTNREL